MKKQKLLNKEEEYKLISSWQNTKDNKSLVKLLDAYKKLVVSLCKKFSSYGLPNEDLVQEGTMGLMYAIEKFDTSKGFRLSTYSRWWIRAMIQDYIIKNWSIVKNGSTASQKILFFSFNKIKKMINFDSLKTMNINDVEKISKMLNMKPLDIEHLDSRLKMGDQSLNQTIKENESTVELIDLLKDESDTQHNIVQKNNDGKLKKKWISHAINNLDEREQYIINSRKFTDSPTTLDHIGKKLKISKERVRQIEVMTLQKLKKNILQISNQTKDFFIN
ncbi:MAG: RNA polymerase factor sigma-32 [Pelagibacteraceae bacterium]|nr:RNA polymerase factor sigma-32 [Pelagibacteraceae bacterium]|tara:strand:+ start:3814 stop:4641 length:828 start_codon:yes stop_codon:yes gene_type:complete